MTSPAMSPGERRLVQEDRELMLDFLNNVYPTSLPQRELLDCLLELPRPVEPHKARRDLQYLVDLRLVERTRSVNPITKIPEMRVKLTADGLEFCEAGKPWDSV